MYDFKFADIGEGIHEGQILKWNFKVGDKVKEGETLTIIETDKVNAEIPSPVDGIIIKLGAEVGEVINVGNTLVLIDTGDGDTTVPEETKKVSVAVSEAKKPAPGVVGEIDSSDEIIASATESTATNTTNHKLATPLARKIASDLGIDINKIAGTGENGRVLKEDIENYQQKPSAQSSTPVVAMPSFDENQTRRVPISRTRKAIVKSMTISKQIIPHTILMDEVNVTNLVKFRAEQKELAQSQGAKLTYMAFFIKAITLTLKDFPIFNSSFDHEKEEIIYKAFTNIGIAVDTPDGLTVPNIKNADKLSIFDLAKSVDHLSSAAREKTLTLPEIQNGTFTITNFGSFDATFGAPVIKHPEVAIMGIGKISKKPIVENGEIVIADILPISLAVDHRIIDGADAGRFSIKFKEYLTNPMLLLLS